MKRVINLTCIGLLIVLSLLTSCSSGGRTNSQTGDEPICANGVCLTVVLEEPIYINQPMDLTITVTAEESYSNILIDPSSANDYVADFADEEWVTDLSPSTPETFQTTVTFSTPGYIYIGVNIAYEDIGGLLVSWGEKIFISEEGPAVVNPTPEPQKTPDFSITSANPGVIPTGSAITPFPQTEGFTPQEWLAKCGWTAQQPKKLNLWEDTSANTGIYGEFAVNTSLQGTVTFSYHNSDNSTTTAHVQIGFCAPEDGLTIDGTSQWEVDLQSDALFSQEVSVQFTQIGVFPTFIIVWDVANNRVAGYGNNIMISDPGEMSSPAEEGVIPLGYTSRSLENEEFASSTWPSGSNLWTFTGSNPTYRQWGVQDGMAWIAAGGTTPLAQGSSYPINYQTEMVFGPFNFSTVSTVKMSFF